MGNMVVTDVGVLDFRTPCSPQSLMVIGHIHSILELTQKSAGMLILTNRFLIGLLKVEQAH